MAGSPSAGWVSVGTASSAQLLPSANARCGSHGTGSAALPFVQPRVAEGAGGRAVWQRERERAYVHADVVCVHTGVSESPCCPERAL